MAEEPTLRQRLRGINDRISNADRAWANVGAAHKGEGEILAEREAAYAELRRWTAEARESDWRIAAVLDALEVAHDNHPDSHGQVALDLLAQLDRNAKEPAHPREG